jgi:hypothetical protein
MGTAEAQDVLNEASKSLFPGVRGVARKIIEEQRKQRKR